MAPSKKPFPVMDLESVFLDDHSKCIQTVGTLREQRRCSRPRNKNNNGEERILKVIEVLKSCPPLDSCTRALLAELADLCYCNRSHRGNVDETVVFWLKSYPKELTSTNKSSLRPSTASNEYIQLKKSSQRTPSRTRTRTAAASSSLSNRSTACVHPTSNSTPTNENNTPFDLNHTDPAYGSLSEFPLPFIRRILTRSHTQSTSQEIHLIPEHRYLPYHRTPMTLFEIISITFKLISKPLGPTDKKSGFLYIFDRASDLPNFYKIGHTAIHPTSRYKSWKSKCKYVPIEHFSTGSIPNARRVEQLVFAELGMNRKKESKCKTNPVGCGVQHGEWVEAPLATVMKILQRWQRFMMMEPYDEDGHLKDAWAKHAIPDHVRPVTSGEVGQGARWDHWIDDFISETSVEEDKDENEDADGIEEISATENAPKTRRYAMPPITNPTGQPSSSTVTQRQINEAFHILLRAGVLSQGQASNTYPPSTRVADTHSTGLGRCKTFPLLGMQPTAVLA